MLKHLVPSFPAIAGDIKKPGVTEHGYERTPLKAIHSFMQAWPGLIVDLPDIELTDSYHVAPLDNDAPLIFETSAQFVARVTTA